jgi:ribonuclease HI
MGTSANSTSVLPSVEIYTDGGCEPNPGPGGYGVVLLHPKCQIAYHIDKPSGSLSSRHRYFSIIG